MEIEDYKRAVDNIKGRSWIKWEHITKGYSHCETCLTLDKCHFADDEVPKLPLHENCHCETKPITPPKAGVTAFSKSDINKYRGYLFSEKYKSNGKRAMFESWGYYEKDSESLQKEIEKQGLQKYASGEYTLGKLDKYGQHIDIEIILPRRSGEGLIIFSAGWMVEKNGMIKLNTPFAKK